MIPLRFASSLAMLIPGIRTEEVGDRRFITSKRCKPMDEVDVYFWANRERAELERLERVAAKKKEKHCGMGE